MYAGLLSLLFRRIYKVIDYTASAPQSSLTPVKPFLSSHSLRSERIILRSSFQHLLALKYLKLSYRYRVIIPPSQFITRPEDVAYEEADELFGNAAKKMVLL